MSDEVTSNEQTIAMVMTALHHLSIATLNPLATTERNECLTRVPLRAMSAGTRRVSIAHQPDPVDRGMNLRDLIFRVPLVVLAKCSNPRKTYANRVIKHRTPTTVGLMRPPSQFLLGRVVSLPTRSR